MRYLIELILETKNKLTRAEVEALLDEQWEQTAAAEEGDTIRVQRVDPWG